MQSKDERVCRHLIRRLQQACTIAAGGRLVPQGLRHAVASAVSGVQGASELVLEGSWEALLCLARTLLSAVSARESRERLARWSQRLASDRQAHAWAKA
eukprot:7320939-Alexandrium_andersonii.AAC.1